MVLSQVALHSRISPATRQHRPPTGARASQRLCRAADDARSCRRVHRTALRLPPTDRKVIGLSPGILLQAAGATDSCARLAACDLSRELAVLAERRAAEPWAREMLRSCIVRVPSSKTAYSRR